VESTDDGAGRAAFAGARQSASANAIADATTGHPQTSRPSARRCFETPGDER
jgi:hypothetical protein